FDNTTQDNGDHYVKVGRWADNFEDNNENWIVFPGKTAMDLSAVQAIGTYSFRMDAGNELEYYNYKYNLTSNLTPHTIVVKVYDNGAGNSNLWYVGANNGTDYFMGVDSYGNKVCPSGNTGNFCYRIGNTKYVSSMARQSAGWVTIKYEFNGTHVKGYVNDNLIFTTADSTGLENIRVGNAWSNSGIAYFDEVRVAQTTSGNVTTWHDAGIGNETYRIGVNATTPTNTNYTVWYRENNTDSFYQVGEAYTGNSTIAFSPRYKNTDVRIVLNGDQTTTPKLISITFYTQPVV
ncbi:MAG: hypothetical protein Q7J35_11175, partial [Candidatus Methanoperedens sp.]|nr:hypothetical protein [Candidatus Methanoperedens sp.]